MSAKCFKGIDLDRLSWEPDEEDGGGYCTPFERDRLGRPRLFIPHFKERVLRSFGSHVRFLEYLKEEHDALIRSQDTLYRYYKRGIPACKRRIYLRLLSILKGCESQPQATYKRARRRKRRRRTSKRWEESR